jgi:signal transduction histidine kinase
MTRARPSWIVFSVCTVLVIGTLVWTSVVVLRLERAEHQASARSEHQRTIRQAMWRMDSWLSMFVAREAARPYTDYIPLETRDTPSPLLAFKSDYIRMHFHVDPSARITSPQGNALDHLESLIDVGQIDETMARAEGLSTTKLANAVNQIWYPTGEQAASAPEPDSEAEFNARVQCTVPPTPGLALTGDIAVNVGPLIPQWLQFPESGEHELVFVRRLQSQGNSYYQGFIGDWPKIRQRLLGEIVDLFPAAQLNRVSTETDAVDPFGQFLANIPVALITVPAVTLPSTQITSVRMTLALAWLVSLIAAVIIGLTLHKSLELGERRRRFVSAVTHEMRTPLTTFRMYSEMLADGVVSETHQRQEYLETLKEESARLSTMVENVLTHSRLEARQTIVVREQISLGDLLERVTPPLVRKAETCGMRLVVSFGPEPETPLTVHVESVGQVLRNLVDNATKYARDINGISVQLSTEMTNGTLLLRVRDSGPGIPAKQARAIFKPFDRGGREPSDTASGIGLGLALSRGLARDMGGDLTLENPGDDGACFLLEVPAQPA